MRESRDRRRGRPAVSQNRNAVPGRREWRTLREASELTGIPISTLRKWCRRDTVNSYLESDGELTLRMVEMGSVRAKRDTSSPAPVASHEPEDTRHETRDTRHEAPPASPLVQPPEPATMIVPVDAWNKMLTQLGNLHEAGQQLAEARERAAKAETEASFLRERLAEMRETSDSSPSPQDLAERSEPEGVNEVRSTQPGKPDGLEDDNPASETAPFWRYVVRGWRERRR